MIKASSPLLLSFILCLFFFPALSQDKHLYDSAKKLLPNQALEAEKIALEFLRQAREKDVDSMEARGHYLLGTINYYLGHYYISVDHFDKALRSDFVKKDLQLAESCWNNIGTSYDKLGMTTQALKAYHESLLLAEKRKDSTGIGETWINIGLLAGNVDNFKTADSITRKALKFFISRRDSLNMALCYQNLSMFYNEQGITDSSTKYTLMSLDLYKALNDHFGMAVLTNSLGVKYSDNKQYEAACRIQEQALALAKELGITGLEGVVYMNMGENMLALGRYAEAENLLKQAFASSDSAHVIENHERLYWLMTDLYARQGNYPAYRKTAAAFQEFMEKQTEENGRARYDELMNLYEHDKKEARIGEQEAQLRQRRKQLWLMGAIIVLVCAALVIITILYMRSKRLMRSLYLSNVAQTQQREQSLPVPELPAGQEEKKNAHAELFARIEEKMRSEKLFRRSSLTIAELSAELGSNEKYISQAINSFGGKNFNGFLNDYRINEAKKLMLSGNEFTLKQIAADCGFSNPSTFYRQFKELTGLTPSTFYDMCRQDVQREAV